MATQWGGEGWKGRGVPSTPPAPSRESAGPPAAEEWFRTFRPAAGSRHRPGGDGGDGAANLSESPRGTAVGLPRLGPVPHDPVCSPEIGRGLGAKFVDPACGGPGSALPPQDWRIRPGYESAADRRIALYIWKSGRETRRVRTVHGQGELSCFCYRFLLQCVLDDSS